MMEAFIGTIRTGSTLYTDGKDAFEYEGDR